ncbi:MAG TPA: hypothetical protein VFR84_16000 [Candidatus Angelobacter sp.]|nr:hypothetical protein [Candidatus Angelobacter sp.]
MPPRQITDPELEQIIAEVISHAHHREETYLPRSVPLTPAQKEALRPYFSRELLDRVRVLELENERVANPGYYARAEKRGYKLMLNFTHKAVIAHPQLLIFQDKLSLRLLFHGLVHVAQYSALGRERYLGLYVRAFIHTGSYTSVPLEMQAFQLDNRYTEDPGAPFSVEDEVRKWSQAENYALHQKATRTG